MSPADVVTREIERLAPVILAVTSSTGTVDALVRIRRACDEIEATLRCAARNDQALAACIGRAQG